MDTFWSGFFVGAITAGTMVVMYWLGRKSAPVASPPQTPAAPPPPAPQPQPAAPAAPQAQGDLACPHCGKPNRNGAKMCASCGKSLVVAPANGRKCSRCGATAKDGAKFCLKCGKAL